MSLRDQAANPAPAQRYRQQLAAQEEPFKAIAIRCRICHPEQLPIFASLAAIAGQTLL